LRLTPRPNALLPYRKAPQVKSIGATVSALHAVSFPPTTMSYYNHNNARALRGELLG